MFKKNILYLINSFKARNEISCFERLWLDFMVQRKLYTINKETFGLNYTEKTAYGYKSFLYIPKPFSVDDVKKILPNIETAFNSYVSLSLTSDKRVYEIDFITNLDKEKVYKMVPVKRVSDVYIGDDFAGYNIILDFLKSPSVLIVGAPRQGKTSMMYLILSNLSKNFSSKEVEFYLYQLDKCDFALFEDNKNTKICVERDFEKMRDSLNDILAIMNKRSDLIRPLLKKALATNFVQYNEKVSEKNKFSAIYIFIDEMAGLESKSDSKTKKIRDEIKNSLHAIATKGATYGIFMVMSLQRPDANNLDTLLKSCAGTTISFKVNNSKSSEVCLDDPFAALNLKKREFVFNDDSVFKYGSVPNINLKYLIEENI